MEPPSSYWNLFAMVWVNSGTSKIILELDRNDLGHTFSWALFPRYHFPKKWYVSILKCSPQSSGIIFLKCSRQSSGIIFGVEFLKIRKIQFPLVFCNQSLHWTRKNEEIHGVNSYLRFLRKQGGVLLRESPLISVMVSRLNQNIRLVPCSGHGKSKWCPGVQVHLLFEA